MDFPDLAAPRETMEFVDLDALGDVESVEFVDLAFVFLFWQTLSRWN